MLKFRFWDKEKKIFVYSSDFGHLGYGNNQEGENRKLSQFFNSVGKNKIQQFTGLTDKNEKEIYVGDLLRISAGFGCEWNQTIGEVIFSSGCGFNVYNKFGSKHLGFIDFECPKPEIVGNIFIMSKNI